VINSEKLTCNKDDDDVMIGANDDDRIRIRVWRFNGWS